MLQEGRAATEAHAEARIRPIVAAGASTALRVVLTAPGSGATDAAGPVLPRHLSVTVEPHGLKTALGTRRRRTLRLSPGGTAGATFRLVGVERGPAEVAVVIRGEGDAPLATLRLTVEVVAADDHDQTGLARVTAVVPSRPAEGEAGQLAFAASGAGAEPAPLLRAFRLAWSGSTA